MTTSPRNRAIHSVGTDKSIYSKVTAMRLSAHVDLFATPVGSFTCPGGTANQQLGQEPPHPLSAVTSHTTRSVSLHKWVHSNCTFHAKNFILWEFPKLKGPICKGKPFSWGASALWKSSGMYILGTIHAEDPLQAKHWRAWHPAHGHQHVRREHRHHAGAGCCASLGSWYFWVWQGKNQKTHIVDRGCTAETMLLRAQLPNSQGLSKLSVLCAYGCGSNETLQLCGKRALFGDIIAIKPQHATTTKIRDMESMLFISFFHVPFGTKEIHHQASLIKLRSAYFHCRIYELETTTAERS